MLGEELEDITTAIEVQEELRAFTEADQRKIEESRDVISAIEERVNILRRSCGETWDLLSERLTSELDRAPTALNDRVAEIERMVRTRSASPATTVEQNPTVQEDVARLESRIEARFQAFAREVDLPREEIAQSLEGHDKNLNGQEGRLLT